MFFFSFGISGAPLGAVCLAMVAATILDRANVFATITGLPWFALVAAVDVECEANPFPGGSAAGTSFESLGQFAPILSIALRSASRGLVLALLPHLSFAPFIIVPLLLFVPALLVVVAWDLHWGRRRQEVEGHRVVIGEVLDEIVKGPRAICMWFDPFTGLFLQPHKGLPVLP